MFNISGSHYPPLQIFSISGRCKWFQLKLFLNRSTVVAIFFDKAAGANAIHFSTYRLVNGNIVERRGFLKFFVENKISNILMLLSKQVNYSIFNACENVFFVDTTLYQVHKCHVNQH